MDKPYRKKLIEVALPLDAINAESAREKSIRHGHPSTLHIWWARRPLAACRAVLFSQLVDDPSEYMPDEESANEERERLFHLIEELVKWENINNEELLDKARLEIARSIARDIGEPMPIGKKAIQEFLATKAPPVLDPFAGGGSIPLEAQRLGLRTYAGDLNPVAVLISKALLEIPPKFTNMPPLHPPEDQKGQKTFLKKSWKGAEGLAEDVRYYGHWIRDEAEKQIGYLYPEVSITEDMLADRPDLEKEGYTQGDVLTVIAWSWARTVKCPNPACEGEIPLVRSFWLSKKSGKKIWIEPVITRYKKRANIEFKIKMGEGVPPYEGTTDRNGAECLICHTTVTLEYIRHYAQTIGLGQRMMSVIADGRKGRIYLAPDETQLSAANNAKPRWIPAQELQGKCTVSVPLYGMISFGSLFTNRQLVTLQLLKDLIHELHEKILLDLNAKSDLRIEHPFDEYSDAIVTYIGLAISKNSHYWSNLSTWHSGRETMQGVFARQAIPMVWDFAECNIFSNSSGNLLGAIEWNSKVLENLVYGAPGKVEQLDAVECIKKNKNTIISTDPPYYDNIEYADLSDFFYIWLRYFFSDIYPDLFSTLLTPKKNELVASPFRFEKKEDAESFFEEGLSEVFANVLKYSTKYYPISVFYAYKQTESSSNEYGRTSTGWETMLYSLIKNNFQIVGTWPMRTEMAARALSRVGTNALASSVVLICRQRSGNAQITTRRDFMVSLRRELPNAIRQLQIGSIAPVDFAQAVIGPGMAVFSSYQKVLEADGTPMRVRTALALINQEFDEFLAEQEGEFDTDTRWALAWYEQYGHREGPFGVAETLSKAKNTSVEGLEQAGILEARAGKVKLLHRSQLVEDWDPIQDKRLTVWEITHYLIQALEHGGESEAAFLLSRIGSLGESARDLAYWLYTICDKKGWAQDALGYNMLVVAWPRLKEMARQGQAPTQEQLF